MSYLYKLEMTRKKPIGKTSTFKGFSVYLIYSMEIKFNRSGEEYMEIKYFSQTINGVRTCQKISSSHEGEILKGDKQGAFYLCNRDDVRAISIIKDYISEYISRRKSYLENLAHRHLSEENRVRLDEEFLKDLILVDRT